MPATRSGKSSLRGKRSSINRHSIVPDGDIIIISSDEEAPYSTTVQLQRGKVDVRILKKKSLNKETSSSQVLSEQGNQQPASHFPIHKKTDGEQHRLETLLRQATADINELQSSLRLEKDARVTESAKFTKLEKRMKKAERENAELKSINKELLNQIGRIRSQNSLHELEDHILCEICQDRLWYPYTLKECGHTLCQGCLTDWFNTAMAANVGHPDYECPKCRAPVYHKPTENYTVKELVRAIAHGIDPASVSPPPPLRQNTGRFGPWFRFFGH